MGLSPLERQLLARPHLQGVAVSGDGLGQQACSWLAAGASALVPQRKPQIILRHGPLLRQLLEGIDLQGLVIRLQPRR